MAHSFAQMYTHIVFSTKNRHPFFLDESIRGDTYAYLGAACKGQGCPVLKVGGAMDHVHILCRLSRTIAVADLLYQIKKESSKWLKTKSPDLYDFKWQEGYGAFSVSPAHVDWLVNYIAKQDEHHQTESFKKEFLRFLERYDIEYDERYVWE